MAEHRDPGSLKSREGLEVVVREEGTTTAIELHGECDLAGLARIRETVCRVMDGVPECIVLDLSRLGFIDSSGLHATVELARRSAAQNTRLVIIPGPGPVQRVFEISGLLEMLPFIDKRPGSSVATLHTAQRALAGSGSFSPPASSATGRFSASSFALSNSSSPPRPRLQGLRAKRRRRPGAGSRP